MSFDIWLEVNTGSPDGPVRLTEDLTPTYNLAEMFTNALNGSIRQFDGKPASEARIILEAGLNSMLDNPKHYKQWNPPNGWGDYAGACWVIETLLTACKKHPLATVRVT